MMDPLNKKVRSRAIGRFIIYYAVSLLVIALVIFFFVSPDYFFSVKNRISDINLTESSSNQQVVQQVDSLNRYLEDLQQLDQKHFSGQVDSLSFMNRINALEDSCAFLINSINSNYNYSNDLSGRLTERIITSYTTFLDIHKQLIRHQGNNIAAVEQIARTKEGQSTEQVSQLLSDIKKRDETVSLLQSQLHNLQAAGVGNNNSDNSKAVIQQLQDENNDLRKRLSSTENQNNQIQSNYAQLQNENTNLKASINLLMQKQSSSTNSQNAAYAKEIEGLQDKVNLLNARISLANVDCEIKRADVNSNVSSARQRKDLLTEALKSLNTLVKSDNTDIQREARARINALNNVAKTIRE